MRTRRFRSRRIMSFFSEHPHERSGNHFDSLSPAVPFSRLGISRLQRGVRFRPRGAAGLGENHHDRHQGPGGRRGQDPGARAAPCPAISAKPGRRTVLPIVLVVQEIFGVHEHIKDICRRLAKLGYLAVAPELYARQGDVSKLTDIQRDHLQGRLQGARRAGDVRSRRHRRLGQEIGQGRHGEARHHRLLLGRADRLALRGAQPGPEGGRRLVRPARRPDPTELHPKHPIDLVG